MLDSKATHWKQAGHLWRVQREVRDMTAGEVIAAIDHLTAGSTRIAAREKLARLRQVVAQKVPDRAEAERAARSLGYERC
jgi:hypothetical protein